MNNISKILLSGAAVAALGTAPALAAPHFSVTALHQGAVAKKTMIVNPAAKTLTYTVAVSSYVPASDMGTPVNLIYTYYKWNSNRSICTTPKEKVKIAKKSKYGKLGHNTETYSLGCASGPTVYYGDTYDLTNSAGEGNTDSFTSKLLGKFKNSGVKYKGTLNFNINVRIGS